MATTGPPANLPYPLSTDPVAAGAAAIQALAEAVNARLALPRGLLAVRRGTASAFTLSTVGVDTDITVTAGQPPSINIALDPARSYRVHFVAPIQHSITARTYASLYINGVQIRISPMVIAGGVGATTIPQEWIITPTTAAAVIYKVMARNDNGSNTSSWNAASAIAPIEFSIEDIGANPTLLTQREGGDDMSDTPTETEPVEPDEDTPDSETPDDE